MKGCGNLPGQGLITGHNIWLFMVRYVEMDFSPRSSWPTHLSLLKKASGQVLVMSWSFYFHGENIVASGCC